MTNPTPPLAGQVEQSDAIPAWHTRVDWYSGENAVGLMAAAMKAEITDLRAALAARPATRPVELEMLREVVRVVRQYPDFDADDSPFGVMMDEALDGKVPALLGTINHLANGLMPLPAPVGEVVAASAEPQEGLVAPADEPTGFVPPPVAAPVTQLESTLLGWVSIKDRRPDLDVPVWLYEPGRGLWIGGRSDGGDGWLWCDCDGSQYQRDGKWCARDFNMDDDYQPTMWKPLPSAPVEQTHARTSARTSAILMPAHAADEMDKVAQDYAHSLALNLECIIADDYSGKWYTPALEVLGKYRQAMAEIHERESPTHMGEPLMTATVEQTTSTDTNNEKGQG